MSEMPASEARLSPAYLARKEPLPKPRSTLGAEGASGDGEVSAFVRTSFDVRRNVVKVWRPLPSDLWTVLVTPDEVRQAKQREKRAVVFVGLIAAVLLAGVSGVGYRARLGDDVVGFPLVGGVVASDAATLGWYFSPGQTLPALFWVVVPSLVGWAFVRALWIPLVAAGRATRTATLTFARHLSGVYFYVYVMLIVGALLLPLLTLLAPADTATLRWCLWCFLFGESFFVPGLMWARLVGRDSSGWVLGRQRYAVLAAYVVLFVVIPIVGMAVENSRGVR